MLPCLGHYLSAELRQLVEATFAQESEWMRVAVLQHLLDNCGRQLISAPPCIGEVTRAWMCLVLG